MWSIKVRNTYDNKCVICGSDKFINAHHIESRKNSALRFDIKNGVALCPKCHKFGINSAHNSPIWFHQWLLKNTPETIGYILDNRDNKPEETIEYIEEIIKRLSE